MVEGVPGVPDSLYADLSVWAVFGMAVNGLARGIRNKPLNYRPKGYMFGALGGIAFGLVADVIRQRQKEFRDRRLSALLASRESRTQAE